MREVVLRVRDLRKAYKDVVAVNGLDLEVQAGECFGLLGPERRRQDHDDRDLRRPHGARLRRRRGARPAVGDRRRRIEAAARHPAPGDAALRQAHGRGDRAPVSQLLSQRPDAGARHRARAARGEARVRASARCRAVRSSGSRSRARSSAIRSSCFSTSRRRGSIRRRAASSGSSSRSSSARAARSC